MKNRISYLCLLIALIIVGCQSTSNKQTEVSTSTVKQILKTNQFNIHYDAIDADQSKQIETWLNDGQVEIESFFNLPFTQSFDVTLFSHRDSLDKQWQQDWGMPDFKSQCWMVASGVAHRLDILSPRIWDEQACEHPTKDTAATRKIIVHELVHVFHGQNNPSPTFDNIENIDWFVEGLATYVSGQLDEERMNDLITFLEESGGPTTLSEFWKGSNRYGLAGSMVAYIDVRFGRAMLSDLLKLTKGSELLAALDISESELIENWKAGLLD